jgi:N-acetyl-gamma-glutamyl-phosphate reductase
MSARVHVLGAAGFAGAETAATLERHPGLELGMISARSDVGRRLVDVAPEHRVERVLEDFDPEAVEAGDLVCVCYPHTQSVEVVADLVDRGARVVDVGADHRLRDPALYEEWYGFTHGRPEHLEEAVYGLPEMDRSRIPGARIVANPGCFPTAAILALLPVADRVEDPVIDAATGVSGAGKGASWTVHYSRVGDNVNPYGVPRHRHTPEIEQALGMRVTFVPHLVPVDRGLLATCHARFTDEVPHPDDLRALYALRYENEPFVELVDAPPGLRAVQRTNHAQVFPHLDARTGRLVAFCAIDNLGKGAAGAAVQNLNLMAGRPEDEGLR